MTTPWSNACARSFYQQQQQQPNTAGQTNLRKANFPSSRKAFSSSTHKKSKENHLGSKVGRVDNLVPGHADLLGRMELGRGRAVHAASFLVQNFEDCRVRQRLDGVKLLEVGKMLAKRLQQVPGVLADELLAVELQRRPVRLGEGLEALLGGFRQRQWHLGLGLGFDLDFLGLEFQW